jgi:hypothetical protein
MIGQVAQKIGRKGETTGKEIGMDRRVKTGRDEWQGSGSACRGSDRRMP